MDRRVQHEINRYICTRMLENECEFIKTCLSYNYERYYAALENFYKPCLFPEHQLTSMVIHEYDYYRIIRSALHTENVGEKPTMKSFIIIYLVTKHLVIELNKINKETNLVVWMNCILDCNEINWNIILPRESSTCQIL